jgi:hypothetical protein
MVDLRDFREHHKERKQVKEILSPDNQSFF